jgi:hypothetical protein
MFFYISFTDQNVRIYNTEMGKFDKFKTIRARDVGWSVRQSTTDTK